MRDGWTEAFREEALAKSPGLKYDNGKPPMELLDREFLEEVAKVLNFGAQKHSAHNWRNGIQVSRLIGAAIRHIVACNDGESTDPESGLSHLGHAGCCLMFALWMERHRPALDDRWRRDALNGARKFFDSKEPTP